MEIFSEAKMVAGFSACQIRWEMMFPLWLPALFHSIPDSEPTK